MQTRSDFNNGVFHYHPETEIHGLEAVLGQKRIRQVFLDFTEWGSLRQLREIVRDISALLRRMKLMHAGAVVVSISDFEPHEHRESLERTCLVVAPELYLVAVDFEYQARLAGEEDDIGFGHTFSA